MLLSEGFLTGEQGLTALGGLRLKNGKARNAQAFGFPFLRRRPILWNEILT
jgi:hypothetical protein